MLSEMTFIHSFCILGLLRPRVHSLKWRLGLLLEYYCKSTSNTYNRYSPNYFPKNLPSFTKVTVHWRRAIARFRGLLQTVFLLIQYSHTAPLLESCPSLLYMHSLVGCPNPCYFFDLGMGYLAICRARTMSLWPKRRSSRSLYHDFSVRRL